jgi:hypothetical protein
MENDISDKVTLSPHANVSRNNAGNGVLARTDYHLGMSARVLLSRNTYLLPTIGYDRTSSVDNGHGFHIDAGHGFNETLALYRLF